ncbi:MAG: DNA-processing protein DprA [Acidobacteriota bacterium]
MSSTREILISLNSEALLPRASICRLALEVERWAGGLREAPANHLAVELGLPAAHIQRALGCLPRAKSRAAELEAEARVLGAEIVTAFDPEYPRALTDLPLPPPVLHVRGKMPILPGIAIVGSRRVDAYGAEASSFFARDLADRGLTIVSGFAVGADAAAHRGALAAGGPTVAVLGCGLEIDYPAGHRTLGNEIAACGAVISEFPCSMRPQSWHFPVRNRIIAALAYGTLVVQATPRSGSLVSARLAMELGRDVYALPGRIFDERSIGPNGLIRDGALLVQHPQDIVESLPIAVQETLQPAASSTPGATHGLPGGIPGLLLGFLVPGQPVGAEELAQRSQQAVERVQGALVELELGGWIRRFPGGAYGRRA